MNLKYRFFYTNPNNILGHFLDFYGKKSSLKFSIIDNQKDEISLTLQGDDKEILFFNDNFIKFIPNSIFLNSTKVEICDEFCTNNYKYNGEIFANFTPKNLEIFDTKNQLCENEFEILSDIWIFDENFIKIEKQNFDKYLNFAIQTLKNNKILKIKNSFGEFEISNGVNFNADFLMPTNLKNLHKIAICDDKTAICLQSYEKPLINLKINSLYLQNHKNSPRFFNFKSSSDIFIYALTKELSKFDIFFISFKQSKIYKQLLKISVLNDRIIFMQNPFLSKNLEQKQNKNLALFGMILQEFEILDKDKIKIFLSKNKNDEIKFFKDQDEFDFLKIKMPSSFEEIKNMIKNSENGEKLLINFEKKFKFPQGKIDKNANFFSLFEIVAKILNFKSQILQNSNLYLGQKGPRIDYKIIDKNIFDIVKFIKSGMSFALADVDENTISFGYVESLAFFISDLIDDIKSNFTLSDVVCFGEIFGEKSFCDLALKHLNLPEKIKISKFLPLEFYD